jgi:hypothetical protein
MTVSLVVGLAIGGRRLRGLPPAALEPAGV